VAFRKNDFGVPFLRTTGQDEVMDDTNATNGTARRGHVAYYPKELFERGLGQVVVARFKGGGQRVEAGVFLIDAWCLGVKNAFLTELTPATFQTKLLDRMRDECTVVPIEPACARKLIEQAVKYAAGLGFAPPPDFKQAARVFGGIKAADCPQSFTFGKDGKPLYFQGPNESPEQAERILVQLERRSGKGNYHFVVGGPLEGA
jgi:hypothetical protein